VPDLAAYGADEKRGLWKEVDALEAHPLSALTQTDGARNLLTRTMPNTTVNVLGALSLALVAFRAPATAAILALGIVPLALMYASGAGFLVLELVSAPTVVKDVDPYFGLLGLLSLAIGLTALTQAAFRAAAWRPAGIRRVTALSAIGSLVIWAAWKGSEAGLLWFAGQTSMAPEMLLVLGTVIAVGVIAVAKTRGALMPPFPLPSPVLIALTAALAAPFAAPDWAFGGMFANRHSTTLAQEFHTARESASVLNWPAYYDETLRQSIVPPIPVPETVVSELRRRIPPRSVLLADPRYSCALVVLFDAYCINPEKVYNALYFRSAERYHSEYVGRGENGTPQHPFFNANSTLSTAEERLLTDYNVSYLLTDPESTEWATAKLTRLSFATLEYERDGYRLYKVVPVNASIDFAVR